MKKKNQKGRSKINENLKELKNNYAVIDTQDLLAMTVLQYATDSVSTNNAVEFDQLSDEIISLRDELIDKLVVSPTTLDYGHNFHLIGLILGASFGGVLALFFIKRIQRSKEKEIIEKAQVEAENIKKDKIIQAKEKFLELKEQHEKTINSRERKIQDREYQFKQENSLKRAEELKVEITSSFK